MLATRDDIETAAQLCVNSYQGKHGPEIQVLQNVRWFIRENDMLHTGERGGKTFISITGSTGEGADWDITSKSGNENILVVPYGNDSSAVRVHRGWLAGYLHLRADIHEIVKNCENIILVGHSRGGALSTLAAVDINYNFPDKNICVITEGSPRVGNEAFQLSYNKRCPDTYRYVYGMDYVAQMPPEVLGYRHIGTLFEIGKKNCFYRMFPPAGIADHYPSLYLEAIKE